MIDGILNLEGKPLTFLKANTLHPLVTLLLETEVLPT